MRRRPCAAVALLAAAWPPAASAGDADALLAFKAGGTTRHSHAADMFRAGPDPDGDLASWTAGSDPCGLGWHDASLGWRGVTCCVEYGASRSGCFGGNAGRVTRLEFLWRPFSANISALAGLGELEFLELSRCSGVFGDIAPLAELQRLALLDLLGTRAHGNATRLRESLPLLADAPLADFRYSYCSWHDCPEGRGRLEGASDLAGTDDSACCAPAPGPPACASLADFNTDAVGEQAEAVSHATDGTIANFIMQPAGPGVVFTDGEALTRATLDAAIQGTFTCMPGYVLRTERITLRCSATGSAARLSAQPCLAVCDTLADLDETAVRGCGAVVNATNGPIGPPNFTMAIPTPGLFVSGSAVADALLDLAVEGYFNCNPGMMVDPQVQFLCDEAGGVATMSGQPCVLVVPDAEAELEAERQDCLALVAFRNSGEPWGTGVGHSGWTAGGAAWVDNDGSWDEAGWNSGCQDFRTDCAAGLAAGSLNCVNSSRQLFWQSYCEEEAAGSNASLRLRGVCPQRTAPECLLTCECLLSSLLMPESDSLVLQANAACRATTRR